jgi:hypothetical protein
VVAVGNPFGLGAREPPGSSPRWGATSNGARTTISCQIDAPINRGNSGGPTFNLHGQVIGTNPAIYSVSGGSVRIGFAAPANIAKASSRPAQGTLARQPPLSSANLAVCDGDRAVAASPDGRPLAGTTALVLALTELTPLGAAISDQRCAPRPENEGRGLVKERSLDYDSITTRHAAAFNYVKKPDCPPSEAKTAHVVSLAVMSPLLWLRVWRATFFSLCSGQSLQSRKRTARVY